MTFYASKNKKSTIGPSLIALGPIVVGRTKCFGAGTKKDQTLGDFSNDFKRQNTSITK